ncbi:MAG: hypothetical protein LBG83_06255 [Oscillospiraceae bacterium]|nr:hypothetical protein [Oscillospiraceae bacterium]
MNIPEHIYFVMGTARSGKSSVARALHERFGGALYSVDEKRPDLFARARPERQPTMCKKITSLKGLSAADLVALERAIAREMTPMALEDVITLALRHEKVICEGDLDLALFARDIRPDRMVFLRTGSELLHREFLAGWQLPEGARQSPLAQAIARHVEEVQQRALGGKATPEGVREIFSGDGTTLEELTEQAAVQFGLA